MVDEEVMNEAVRRVLYAKFKLGLFENPYVDIKDFEKNNSLEDNKELARMAALESIVLLKNERETLPIKKNITSIAIIGPDANEARLGGYSGLGNNPVSVLQGIKNKVGSTIKINYPFRSGNLLPITRQFQGSVYTNGVSSGLLIFKPH